MGTLLIRVNREVQDISLHICSWRSSKAMLGPSRLLFLLVSSCSRWPFLFPSSRVDTIGYGGETVSL